MKYVADSSTIVVEGKKFVHPKWKVILVEWIQIDSTYFICKSFTQEIVVLNIHFILKINEIKYVDTGTFGYLLILKMLNKNTYNSIYCEKHIKIWINGGNIFGIK